MPEKASRVSGQAQTELFIVCGVHKLLFFQRDFRSIFWKIWNLCILLSEMLFSCDIFSPQCIANYLLKATDQKRRKDFLLAMQCIQEA